MVSLWGRHGMLAPYGLALIAATGSAGCMKATSGESWAGVPVVVVPVTAVRQTGGISVQSPPDVSHAVHEPDDARAAGEHVEVERYGTWVPAVLVERRGDRWLVHYERDGAEWDEIVEVQRLRVPVEPAEGDPVEDDSDP